MKTITLIKPDDCHLHLRDGDHLKLTVAHAAKQFSRAIIMPNLVPAITTVEQAQQYQQRILDARPPSSDFQPLMTLYLTDKTEANTIKAAKQSGFIYACKLYPAGATTHSAAGVTSIKKLYPLFETMQEVQLPLLIHGESTNPNTDIFDRENEFIEQELQALTQQFPDLPLVLEHITTKHAVDFILSAANNVCATITAHHLLLNRNAIFQHGINPHHYCLPILKRESHQQALITAATSGNPKFFLGTDSAPHSQQKKLNACGCAGIYSAHAAIELYAQIFEQANTLDKLQGFASQFGADFYQLPHNEKQITLEKNSWEIPDYYQYNNDKLIPLGAGTELHWKIKQK